MAAKWKCPICGSLHQDSVQKCKCGFERSRDWAHYPVFFRPDEANMASQNEWLDGLRDKVAKQAEAEQAELIRQQRALEEAQRKAAEEARKAAEKAAAEQENDSLFDELGQALDQYERLNALEREIDDLLKDADGALGDGNNKATGVERKVVEEAQKAAEARKAEEAKKEAEARKAAELKKKAAEKNTQTSSSGGKKGHKGLFFLAAAAVVVVILLVSRDGSGRTTTSSISSSASSSSVTGLADITAPAFEDVFVPATGDIDSSDFLPSLVNYVSPTDEQKEESITNAILWLKEAMHTSEIEYDVLSAMEVAEELDESGMVTWTNSDHEAIDTLLWYTEDDGRYECYGTLKDGIFEYSVEGLCYESSPEYTHFSFSLLLFSDVVGTDIARSSWLPFGRHLNLGTSLEDTLNSLGLTWLLSEGFEGSEGTKEYGNCSVDYHFIEDGYAWIDLNSEDEQLSMGMNFNPNSNSGDTVRYLSNYYVNIHRDIE